MHRCEAFWYNRNVDCEFLITSVQMVHSVWFFFCVFIYLFFLVFICDDSTAQLTPCYIYIFTIYR